jgi:phosphohistidine phosphatase
MRHLLLIRHAKAAAGVDDHERPLAERGFADAVPLGRWIGSSGLALDRVVVSTALRARQTWTAAAAELDGSPDAVADDRIYGNTVEDLLAVIRDTPSEVQTLVLVGHNPSMAELAIQLDDGSGSVEARDALARSFPTSGVASFDVPVEWDQLKLGGATVTGFVVARASGGAG